MPAKKGTRPPNAGKGRPKGSTNRTTRDVREAVSALVQGNNDNLEKWLQRIAKSDPSRAFDLILKLMEYHIPKLARTELAIEPKDEVEDMYLLTDAELMAIIVSEDPVLEKRARRRAAASKREKSSKSSGKKPSPF